MSLTDLPIEPEHYVAEIRRSDGQSQKIFRGPGKRRIDSDIADPKTITIYREDLGKIFQIFPRDKAFVEKEIPKGILNAIENPNKGTFVETQGSEKLGELNCDKYCRFDLKSKRKTEEIWIQSETGFRVKTVTINLRGEIGITLEKKYLSVGEPDPYVFEVPRDYIRIQA